LQVGLGWRPRDHLAVFAVTMNERDWDASVATGLPGNLCFGFLSRSEYVPFWLCVLLVTLAVYAYGRAKEAKASAKAKPAPSKPKAASKKNGKVADLEDGLLANAGGAGGGEPTEIRVASEKMAGVCSQAGAAKGLEAASLAVLLAVQHRRRYGTVSAAVIVGGKPREFDVELATPKMSFREMLMAVDQALQALQPAATSASPTEAPEVVFAWDAPPSAEGQWSIRPAGDGQLTVKGSSREEERSFQILFEACTDAPDGDLWELPLVPPASLEQVMAWGAPVRDFKNYRDSSTGRLRPVPQVVAEMSFVPEADAVVGDDFRISAAELRRRSSAVMRAVQDKADPSMKRAVVIYMGRGEAIGPTFLGVLQAGYTVVPVDVHWPSDRVKQVTEDAEAGLAFTETGSMEAWLALGLPVTAMAVDGSLFQQYANGATMAIPDKSPEQDDPAIVLFTSGSTGRPKGIVLSHGYLTALVVGVGESKRMTKDTRTLCYHSPTWMPFLDYLFAPMILGGCCLYFPESGTHVVRPNELKAFAQKHNATNAGFVPAMLDILVDEGLPKTMSDIGVGGAAVPAELCHRVLSALPPSVDGGPGVLYTGYSGTEQGDVTQLQMRISEDVERGTADKAYMGAGRPHTGQRLAVLDLGFSPVGPGGVGEVSVSGPGLASGYLQLPEKTAETFLPSLKALGGARTARSGDLGKWTPEGNLKIVGRRDSMVKVRGARIELGEVEAAVSSHPDVKATVVTVYEDQLVAYVVPAVPATLRDHCKGRLVAYMVPHLFEGLEELPRLPNGKINKKALPKPEARSDGAETVMELDSLGQMRKFTRRAASEDRVLDNVRAILIGVVIQSHATPLLPTGGQMLDVASRPLAGSWGPVQLLLLSLIRGGGWSSLAFLNGFDDTRSMRPYGLTYREPLFLVLWLILDFNWSMWYLPVFVYMRAMFCAMHRLGLEKVHLMIASQIWILMPAFVDLYIGWKPDSPATSGPCPAQCFCPWEAFPGAQTLSYYFSGWWVYAKDPSGHSMIGHALIFIPCYWIGFYSGGHIFKVLTKVADEASWFKRILVASLVLGLYCVMYSAGKPLTEGFDDRCSAFWSTDGSLVWMQILKNFVYYIMNLAMSLTYVVFIAAAVPVHLKYLAKNCFPALIMSAYTPCLLDFPAMALQLRQWLPAIVSPGIEMAWVFGVPFLYELVVGAIFATIVPPIAKAIIKLSRKIKGQ